MVEIYLENDNIVEKVFRGRIPLQYAVALFQFEKKGLVQHLFHELKYRGNDEISAFLGKWLGERLLTTSWLHDIDVVIPVPLHKKRLRERGYNQVEGFGKELAAYANATYIDTVLVKDRPTSKQAKKGRLDRASSYELELFALQNPQLVENKHILLVDDIVTTGTTLETCANKLLSVKGTSISIATMAVTL
ncbi:ComF family protein [Gangjinia marincola]|uniref:ComF family protein n=1 Tax=Gangjinia marincola TaxID=578463 RepID=A0ABN1MHF5_9FLAO